MKKQIILPVSVGEEIYKICPKCNPNHNGTCAHCAWSGAIGVCDVGVGIWDDGSYNEYPLQLVKLKATPFNIYYVYDKWNFMYFDNEKEANIALKEYDEIRKIEDKDKRVETFRIWLSKRAIKNPLNKESE